MTFVLTENVEAPRLSWHPPIAQTIADRANLVIMPRHASLTDVAPFPAAFTQTIISNISRIGASLGAFAKRADHLSRILGMGTRNTRDQKPAKQAGHQSHAQSRPLFFHDKAKYHRYSLPIPASDFQIK